VKPVDAVILVFSVVIGVVIAVPVLHTLINDLPFDASRAKVINTWFMSIVSIVSMYVGAKLNEKFKGD
jgi:hypothetical protein